MLYLSPPHFLYVLYAIKVLYDMTQKVWGLYFEMLLVLIEVIIKL